MHGQYLCRGDISSTRGWSTRVDFTCKSGSWENFAQLAKTPAQKYVNFRIGVDTEKWNLELFVLNMFDDRAYLSARTNVDVLAPAFAGNVIEVTMPRKREFDAIGKYNF